MQIFDSHCHLDDRSFSRDFDAVLERAAQAGVMGMMVVGIDGKSSRRAVDLAQSYECIIASVGMHPHDAGACSDDLIRQFVSLADDENVRAWGEIGLDYNRMYSPREDQEKWFLRQLETADDLGLPLIFHERDTQGRFLELLGTRPNPKRKAVVHCFSGNGTELEAYLDMGFYIGITGILTIKNRGRELRSLALRVPNDRLLVETDAPYLTPAPQKNKHRRNEPAFVKSVLLKLAEIKEEDPEMLAEAIWENTCRLFGPVA